MDNIYTLETNAAGFYYSNGPGTSFHGQTLFPELSTKTEETAAKMTAMANMSYDKGYQQALKDMRKSMGIK